MADLAQTALDDTEHMIFASFFLNLQEGIDFLERKNKDSKEIMDQFVYPLMDTYTRQLKIMTEALGE